MTQHDQQQGRRDHAGPAAVGEDVITSVRNAKVVAAAKLSRRRERRDSGTYLVEGPNAVGEVMAEGDVVTLFCTPERVPSDLGDVELVVVSETVLARLADSQSPQGVVAVARMRQALLSELSGSLIVALEEPADPGNLGTIIRTADAGGASGVVVVGEAVDPYNPKVVRATAGSLVHLPIVSAVDLADLAHWCKEHGWELVGLDAGGDAEVFELERSTTPIVLLLGSEAHGLSSDARAACDRLLRVPTHGRAESLNLAAAAAVSIYAAARGRQRPQASSEIMS